MSVEPGDDAALDELAALLRELGLDVARVLVLERQDAFTPAGPITTEDSLARVRARLEDVVGGAPFAGGSDQFYSDVNRAPPPEDGLDAVCFGLCPQVHAADDASLMENLPALADCVETARILRPGRPIAVSPVTLVPRLGPYPGGAPVPGGLPGVGRRAAVRPVRRELDARGRRLARRRAHGVGDVLRDRRPAGHRAARGRLRRTTTCCRSRRATRIPCCTCWPISRSGATARCVDVQTSDPLAVTALAVEDAGRRGVLVANHRPDPVTVVVRGLGAERVHVRRLDESTAEHAMVDPAAFRRGGAEEPSPGGELRLELAPYAVARVAA